MGRVTGRERKCYRRVKAEVENRNEGITQREGVSHAGRNSLKVTDQPDKQSEQADKKAAEYDDHGF